MLFVSVVVNDLNLLRSSASPYEADPPLVIHSDAVLASPITFEHLESVPRRHFQLIDRLHRCDLT